jgi:DNA-binding NarL/FixJ family response regulator
LRRFKSGAQGYLSKNLDSAEFFRLMEGVSQGEPVLTRGLARRLPSGFARLRSSRNCPYEPAPSLSNRERKVLELLVLGVPSKHDLAEQLTVTESTVKYHLRNIPIELHAQNRAQVVAHAVRLGLIEPSQRPTG